MSKYIASFDHFDKSLAVLSAASRGIEKKKKKRKQKEKSIIKLLC